MSKYEEMFNEDQRDYMAYLARLPREKRCECGWYLKDECRNDHCCVDGRRNTGTTEGDEHP